jgi:antitoxin ParD1/3/4
MANLNLLIDHDVKDWIESRVEKGEFATSAEYLSELVRRDRESRGEDERIEELRRMIEEAERSGISRRTMEDIRREGLRIARDRGLL